jgi:hypothetical protein
VALSCAGRPLVSLLFTCGDFYAGIFAHVPQLDNDVVLPSRLQLVKGALHCTVAGFYFVAPVRLSYQIFNCNCIELGQKKKRKEHLVVIRKTAPFDSS